MQSRWVNNGFNSISFNEYLACKLNLKPRGKEYARCSSPYSVHLTPTTNDSVVYKYRNVACRSKTRHLTVDEETTCQSPACWPLFFYRKCTFIIPITGNLIIGESGAIQLYTVCHFVDHCTYTLYALNNWSNRIISLPSQ